jgi:adenosine deaminase
VTGERHPFPLIRQFQVPAALSTDDEGVSRIDLTHEYQRAVETYDLSYAALKKMVRTSLEHAFLPGASLWRERDEFTARAPACAKDIAGTDKASAGCREFLRTSEKARQQWELERRFRVFESEF